MAVGILLLSLASTGTAVAEPMNLHDRTPRWVTISFEVSPQTSPDALDSTYTPALPAWLEPGDLSDQVRVVVPGWVVERHVLPEESPKPGTFSSFIWVFDTRTGHVVSAEMSGVLIRRIRWGFLRTEVEADVEIVMSTLEQAGFRSDGSILGQRYAKFCNSTEDKPCNLVDPRQYDPLTGYVNAVGSLDVRSAMVGVHSFSPLGEAVFAESAQRNAAGTETAAVAPATVSSRPTSHTD